MSSPEDRLKDPLRLDALYATQLLDTLPEESFDRFTRLITRVLKTPVSLISLVDEHRQFFKSATGLGEPWATAQQTLLTHSFCQYVVQDAEPLIVEDARRDPRLKDNLAIPDIGVIAYAGVPLVTREGHVLGSFCAIDTQPREWTQDEIQTLKDLAESVITEIELRHQVAERVQAEEAVRQLASIVESSNDAIVGYSLDGTITSWNAAAEQLYGYAAEEVIGRPKSLLIPRGAEDEVPMLLKRIVHGERVEHYETERVCSDGTQVHVSLTMSPIRNVSGDVAGASVIARDVTDRKQVERLKDEFVSLVSHELRTPLTSIRGSLGLLASGKLGDLPERGQRMLEIAAQNVDRLVRLINNILDVERLEAEDGETHREPLPVAEVMSAAAETMRSQAEAAQVEVRVEQLDDTVIADRDQILQVLTNLLSNAIKFSPAGETILLSAARDGRDVRFSVTDRGRGIPSEKVGNLFERFQQVDPSDAREKGGSGLGLYICRRIVEKHGGCISVESAPGIGSTFSFTIPKLQTAGSPLNSDTRGAELN